MPKYRGRTPHVWSIINGETKTGVTVHKIDNGVNTGDILLQEVVVIEENDTGADILKKYEELYQKLIDGSISLIISSKVSFTKQNNTNVSYFVKMDSM